MQAKVTTRKQRPKGPQAKLSEDPSTRGPVKFLRRVQRAWAVAQWIKSAITTRGPEFRSPEHTQQPGRHGGHLYSQHLGCGVRGFPGNLSGITWQALGSVRNSTSTNKAKSRKTPDLNFGLLHTWVHTASLHIHVHLHTNIYTSHTCKKKKPVCSTRRTK